MEYVIEAKHLTKDYGDKRGIFDLNFSIAKGEVFGFVGTNGSGKTTTIRHIMGFLKAQEGSVTVMGLDSWKDSCEIKKYVEYVPGEIAFPDLNDGNSFFKAQAELLGLQNMDYANYLVDRLQLDPSANLKRMSKGMKQKTAIVAAFMADKDILILDEANTGLDPLMRETFTELLLEEKKKGKTILMSSQSFDELEQVCDRVALIFNGHIIDIAKLSDIKNSEYKDYKIEFTTREEYLKFKRLKYEIVRDQEKYNQVTIKIKNSDINRLFNVLKNYHLKFMSEVKYNLEKYFKKVLAEEYLRQEEELKQSKEKDVSEKTKEEIKFEKHENKRQVKKANEEEKSEKFFNKPKVKAEKKENKRQIKEIKTIKKDILKSDKKYKKKMKKDSKKGGKNVQ